LYYNIKKYGWYHTQNNPQTGSVGDSDNGSLPLPWNQ